VLGNAESIVQESFSEGLLDHPHYTRPEEFRGIAVPEVLRGGNHKKIEQWRRLQAIQKTLQKRPDLIESQQEALTPEERKLIELLLNGLPKQD
jgi:tRNA (guanine37-N1)-methyltransferase